MSEDLSSFICSILPGTGEKKRKKKKSASTCLEPMPTLETSVKSQACFTTWPQRHQM